MRISGYWLRRQVAGCLVLLLMAPFSAAATSQQDANPGPQTRDASTVQGQSPTADSSTPPNSPGSVRVEPAGDNPPLSSQQPFLSPHQTGNQEPVGTAAAGPVKTTGVAASKPAGAAIAPAKQRRSRTFLIKVGALLGAGVAVGTVVALSAGSPSRPRTSR